MDQNVRRAINSGLYVIERNIRNLIRELENQPDWILRKSVNDLTEETTRQLAEKSKLMLTEIGELEQAYNLDQTIESTRWRLTNSLSEVWSILNELTSDQLRGYGTMTPMEAEALTNRISKITTLCNEMRNILSNQA